MLYWFRVHAGKPAPGAPYAAGDGHFENNLHGQTAGEFLMGAGDDALVARGSRRCAKRCAR